MLYCIQDFKWRHTLGIIGVIAAISISSIVKGTQNAKIGPSIAKFVSYFETAAGNLMLQEQINDLSESNNYTGDKKLTNFLSSMSGNMNLIPLGSSPDADAYASSYATLKSQGKNVYQTKEGFLVYALDSNWLMLDINGKNKPNKPGLDRFLFYLDNTGKLLPWGKSKLYYSRFKEILGDGISSYPSECNLKSENPWNAYACTRKIADNGWKYN